jgi:hypothetical protein
MLTGYAGRDHYGTDQAKEGLVRAPDPTVRNGGTGYMERSHPTRPDWNQGCSAIAEGCACHAFSFRKEVIQPQVLLRLPCYDFTPIMNYTLDGCLLAVGSPASSATHFRDVTGGVYKARERIHRGILIRDY